MLDGLLLPAEVQAGEQGVRAYDGDEGFDLEALEGIFYEVVTATREEWLALERMHYRVMRRASDFAWG